MTDREKVKERVRNAFANAAWHHALDPCEYVAEMLADELTFAKDTNVLTNGDRVRAMSDEELAEWNNFCPYPTDECTLKGCTNCIREWLKQPAPKGDANG